MVDLEFYKTVYLGSAIPEKAFPGMAARAADKLRELKRICRVKGGEDAEKMAICAMAEAMYAHARSGGVKSANIGGVQVQYDTPGEDANAYKAAGIYLDIYRGTNIAQ